jgi:glycosyltransferase involved in cell wall biosynthesis
VTGPQATPVLRAQPTSRAGTVPLAIVILTYNEEENLPYALESVVGWASEVWVVDALSTDGTVGIARAEGASVVTHEFSGFAAQRNWALRNLPFQPEWVLFLDADEAVTSLLRREIARVLAAPPADVDGYYMKRRFIFLGRWLRHGGYYPVWLLRLVRHRRARCEDRAVDEHLLVDGRTMRLGGDILHEDRRPLSRWVERHIRYARLAADDLRRDPGTSAVVPPAHTPGAPSHMPRTRRGRWDSPHQMERTRWWYERVYLRAPLGLRAVGYFVYRYIVRGGMLDGREGFIYHVLQGLWYRVLIDAEVLAAGHTIEGRSALPPSREIGTGRSGRS